MALRKLSPISKVAIVAATLLFFGSLVFVYTWYINQKDRGELLTDNSINLDPPTHEEKEAGNEIKKEIIENEKERAADPEASKKLVDIVITDAGQYGDIIEVRAFTPDILEKGTCTITFRQGDKVVRKDTPAYPDARTTICTNPEFKRPEFSIGGEWEVMVSFSSQNAQGKSEPRKVIIE